jgi:hypothetical protein
MDIEGILGKIRTAIQRLADNPANHCSDCGQEIPMLPIRIEATEPNTPGSEWLVTNSSFAATKGWYRLNPMGSYLTPKTYCPTCVKNHNL